MINFWKFVKNVICLLWVCRLSNVETSVSLPLKVKKKKSRTGQVPGNHSLITQLVTQPGWRPADNTRSSWQRQPGERDSFYTVVPCGMDDIRRCTVRRWTRVPESATDTASLCTARSTTHRRPGSRVSAVTRRNEVPETVTDRLMRSIKPIGHRRHVTGAAGNVHLFDTCKRGDLDIL